jgi:protein involved in polysaccharide export with SLBB domain
MPALLRAVTAAEVELAQTRAGEEPFICRVGDGGAIVLPAIGELEVGGRSLAEVEVLVTDAYQQYVVLRPSIFARILEYKTSRVYVVGAVQEPGVYALNSDQMTLVSLLTSAGGISEAGAAVVRIIRSDPGSGVAEAFPPVSAGGRGPSTTVSLDGAAGSPSMSAIGEIHPARDRQRQPVITLPVVGRNVPFGDIALEEGDTVVVEPTPMPLFSVVGLVSRPGNFDYPPAATYNLAQAIAFAGGLDVVAEPRYATVYRMGPDGSVIRIAFKLVEDSQFTEALSTLIQPGDIVAVEHTPRTRTNMALHSMLRFNTGVYISGSDLWDPD